MSARPCSTATVSRPSPSGGCASAPSAWRARSQSALPSATASGAVSVAPRRSSMSARCGRCSSAQYSSGLPVFGGPKDPPYGLRVFVRIESEIQQQRQHLGTVQPHGERHQSADVRHPILERALGVSRAQPVSVVHRHGPECGAFGAVLQQEIATFIQPIVRMGRGPPSQHVDGCESLVRAPVDVGAASEQPYARGQPSDVPMRDGGAWGHQDRPLMSSSDAAAAAGSIRETRSGPESAWLIASVNSGGRWRHRCRRVVSRGHADASLRRRE